MTNNTLQKLEKIYDEIDNIIKHDQLEIKTSHYINAAMLNLHNTINSISSNLALKIGDTVTVTNETWKRIKNKEGMFSKKFIVREYSIENNGSVITLSQDLEEGVKLGVCLYAETEEELLKMFIETYACQKCSSFKGTDNEGSFCSKECIEIMQQRHQIKN